MEPIAVFDIGKTNKKFLVFDQHLELIHHEQTTLPEMVDEDGFPTEDLSALVEWMRQTLSAYCDGSKGCLERLNVSTYGASLVHLGDDGEPIAPLYNYLKPLPEKLRAGFYTKYGPPERLALETASPALDMLNSGLQLYWLKHERPNVFKRVKCTLHFPQYLSYLLTHREENEFTSLGCHTALWNLSRSDYHHWVYAEGLDKLFPKPGSATRTFPATYMGMPVKVGTGIHDSSAALLPYLHAHKEPFLLLSTGTWSIALNPFADGALTAEELAKDVLYFLDPEGNPVKSSRLFMGREHDVQLEGLKEQFGLDADAFTSMDFDLEIFRQQQKQKDELFKWQYLEGDKGKIGTPALGPECDYKKAYHRLILELAGRQVRKINLVRQEAEAKTLFVDGGFASNKLFVHMLAQMLPELEVHAVETAQGTALGAALAVHPGGLPEGWLSQHYTFRKVAK